MGGREAEGTEAIAERMGWLAFLFDGFEMPPRPVPVLGVHALVPDCHLNQKPGWAREWASHQAHTKPTKGAAAE